MNQFQLLVLDIIAHEVVPDLHPYPQNNSFKVLIHYVVNFLKVNLDWLAEHSPKDRLCWGILSACTSKIAVNKDRFQWMKNYGAVISNFDLGAVYQTFCDGQLLTQHFVITDSLPSLITSHSSSDLQK